MRCKANEEARLKRAGARDAGAVLLMLGSLEQRRRFAELFEKAAWVGTSEIL